LVAQLCIRLDGIPLALELAAARVRSLSIEQINARLDDCFKLLTGGARTALPRQQTLCATLDWSHDLLTQQERAVLRRLAIFPGSFTLAAASSIASDEAIDEFAVIDLVSQLVARSLVIADTEDAGARYRLLETTRAYALEKLAEAGEGGAIERRHAQYFRGLFDRAPDDWMRMSDAKWSAIYGSERDNIRAALDWAFRDGGDPAIGIALAGASGPIWTKLLLLREGQRRLEAAVAQVGPQTAELDQARLWLWLGILFGEAMPVQSVAAKERAIDLYRRLGEAAGLGFALVHLGLMLPLMGRAEQAEIVFAEAFRLLEQLGLAKALGRCFECYGLIQMRTGKPAAARVSLERALSLCRGAGAETDALNALCNMADVTWALGDLDGAKAGFRQMVASVRKSPVYSEGTLGLNLINLAGVLTEQGKLDDALAAAREALPLLKDGGLAWIFLDHVALRAALAGKVANAARVAGYADSIFAAKRTSRQFNEARAHVRVQALLREKLVPDELERLLAEGAKMSEDEACRLALEE
jgi:tetratricopeptide (TPR) repeat protein